MVPCLSLTGKNLLLDPRAVTSAKKRNDFIQKPVSPLASRVGAASPLLGGRAVWSLDSPLFALDPMVGKTFYIKDR